MRRLKNIQAQAIRTLFDRYGLFLEKVATDEEIPYSYWGSPEAGRLQSTLYARVDTPIHSILHEACHFICMAPELRDLNCIDAGGSAAEENACCYLQLVLSDYLPGFSRSIHLHDMDVWGYNFRLGSSTRWFSADSDDARNWLIDYDILDTNNQPTWRLRKKSNSSLINQT